MSRQKITRFLRLARDKNSITENQAIVLYLLTQDRLTWLKLEPENLADL